MRLKTLLCLLIASLSARGSDLVGNNILLEGYALNFPTNTAAGFAPYVIDSFDAPNPDGTRNLIWSWGLNGFSRNGVRLDTNNPFWKESVEMNWHPPGAYAGQRWVEYYRSIIAPDGSLGFRDSGLTMKSDSAGDGWKNIERVFRQDAFYFSGVPTNGTYGNEGAAYLTVPRSPGAAAFHLGGLIHSRANPSNKGAILVMDGGTLGVFSAGNTNSFFTVLTTSSRSGWSGLPATKLGLNGPARALEVYGHTNVYFETDKFEVTGEISAGSICLPTNAAPANVETPKVWIPVKVNGQMYLMPGYQ